MKSDVLIGSTPPTPVDEAESILVRYMTSARGAGRINDVCKTV
jgi:hypothetical protein